MASLLPRAFGLGPLETIVNVQWLSGYFVYVETLAFYETGTPGSRTTSIIITPAGVLAGGSLLGERHVQQPAIVGPGAQPAATLYQALLKFTKQAKKPRTPLWRAILAGSKQVTDPFALPPMVEPFCGTSSSTGSECYELRAQPWGEEIWAVVALTVTTPAGGGSINFEFQVAGGREILDLPGTCISLSGSSTSVWYRDSFGNWIDTGLPCSSLEGPTPPDPETTTEGWEYVRFDTIPAKGYRAKPVVDWSPIPSIFSTIEDRPGSTSRYGGPQWLGVIGRKYKGLNDDFVPIYDDIANASIDFTNAFLNFEGVPSPKPLTQLFKAYATYPETAPGIPSYSMRAAASSPYRVYAPPQEVIPGAIGAGNTRDKQFPVGTFPSVGQLFIQE